MNSLLVIFANVEKCVADVWIQFSCLQHHSNRHYGTINNSAISRSTTRHFQTKISQRIQHHYTSTLHHITLDWSYAEQPDVHNSVDYRAGQTFSISP